MPDPAAPAAFLTQMHPLDYVRVLYRRRWLVVAVVAVVLGVVAFYNETTVPMYEAQSTVLIEPDTPNIVTFQDVLSEGLTQDGSYFQTQLQILTSRALAARTAAVLKTSRHAGFDALSDEMATDAVLEGLRIVPLRGTRMLSVRFRSTNPATAAEATNAHARQYIQQSLDNRFRASREATDWLDAQLAEQRARVEERESALQGYREQHDAVSLTAGQNIVVQKLADLNAAVTRAKTERIEQEAAYRELLAIRKVTPALDALPAVLANPFIQQLKGELARLQREYSELSESLGERHQTLLAKRTEMETAERRLAAEIDRVVESQRNAFQAAQAQEASLVRALEEQKQEALAQNRRGIEYAALEREAESERVVYQNLLQRAKETGVSEDLQVTNIQIVDPARVPRGPVSPRPVYNLLVGMMSGLLLAVGLVFGLEYVDDRVRTPEDIVGRLGLTVLGLVPELAGKRSKGALAPLLRPDVPPVLVEAVRAMRTTVLTSASGDGPRSIVVASAHPDEGKTFVASSLAIALAQSRQRVLLVDADMRRPGLHGVFGQPLEPGLSGLLAADAALADVLRQTVVPGLTVMTAGMPASEAPELLGSSRFNELFDVLQEHFDWVIVDSPPVLSVTDASVIARRASGVIVLVASGMTRSRAARLAVNELQAAGATVLGAVLTRADLQHHPYYFAPYSRREYRVAPVPARSDGAAATLFGTNA